MAEAPRPLQPALTLFAAGMVGLGVLALVFGDFALVWQPVAPWVPGRTALAYASGVLMLSCGLGLLFRATAAWSVRVLFPYLIAWTLLKVPALVVEPQVLGVWLGLGELTALLAGGFTLFARFAALPAQSPFALLTGDRGLRAARILFALSLLPIGLSHIVYLQAAVHLVPPWLPYRTGSAYITGIGQVASGLGILFGVLPRVAAFAEAGQVSLYALLIWLPAIVAGPPNDISFVFEHPDKRFLWTAFLITWAIAAAAWVVAQSMALKPADDRAHREQVLVRRPAKTRATGRVA